MLSSLIDRFHAALDRAPASGRCEAVRVLAAAWRQPGLGGADREALEAAMGAVLDDPAEGVRLVLAQELANEARAPRHVILQLSQDAPAIAAEVLAQTPVLIDSELVDAVALSPAPVQVAIALRPRLSPALCAAIAAVGDRLACLSMLASDAATLTPSAYATLLARFGDDAQVQEAVFGRADAPVSVRHDLVERSLEGLWRPAGGGRLGEMDAQRLRAAQERATMALAAEAPAHELDVYVAHLVSRGRLTTALLLRAALAGDMRFLEHGLARLSGHTGARVRAIMQEARGPAFRALCLRAGLSERAHAALAAAVEVHREEAPEPGPRAIERVLERYGGARADEMDDVLALMRRLSAEAARTASRDPARRAKQEPRLRANYVGAQRGFRGPQRGTNLQPATEAWDRLAPRQR